jgi:hypothetical protein
MSNGIEWGRVNPDDIKNNIIIIGSGKSLIGFDFNELKGLGTIITVNDSVKSVPFADLWFTLDPWGLNGPQLPANFSGKMFAAVPEDYGTPTASILQHRVTPDNRITFLHRLKSHNRVGVSSETAYKLGLSEDTSCINTGNSGYGALNLAYHYKPKKILLLGIDGTIGYFYTKDKSNRPLTYLPIMFSSAKAQLDASNIEIINGSINSEITAYNRFTVRESIQEFIK